MKMQRLPFLIGCTFLLCSAFAQNDLQLLLQREELRHSVQARSERALLDESVALEQAGVEAQRGSQYGLELRPRISEDDVAVSLRVYLPDRWSRHRLRQQLALAAQSEQLRIAALEWRQLLGVYRDFCTYRLCRTQLDLYAAELAFFKPWLAQADRGVEQNHLAVVDRAKIYSLYLDLLNDREKVEMEFAEIRRRLHRALGSRVNLNEFSRVARIDPPNQAELDALVRQALARRADYRHLGIQVQAFEAAEADARSEEGFRFKYFQPEYRMSLAGGSDQTFGLSAAFVLPWGSRSSDAAVYQQERMLAVAAMEQQRQSIRDGLQVLLDASSAFDKLAARRRRLVQPLVDQLKADLAQLEHPPLEQLRDLLAIRERILKTALQAADAEARSRRIAVDFAEELGALSE